MGKLSGAIQNLFLGFLSAIKWIFGAMHEISNFYGEYGPFFFIFLLALYGTDTYLSKNVTKINNDTKIEKVKDASIYPKWKIILVLFIGADCFFDLGIRDNITYIILIAYAIYVLRRLLVIMKFQKQAVL